jgi:type III secretory pathway lipoprotein EscJ
LVPKEKRKDGKLSNRANISLLIGYKSDNNFLIYILNIKKVINTKNIIIKEELEFNLDY